MPLATALTSPVSSAWPNRSPRLQQGRSRAGAVALRAAAAGRIYAPASPRRGTGARVVPGKSFGRLRIQRAVELAGACIMLAVFVVLALFA